jgi:predicted  nucleic acid-binding Zn-ribbon protein
MSMTLSLLQMAGEMKGPVAAFGLVGVMFATGLNSVTETQEEIKGNVHRHQLEFIELKKDVSAVGKDVSYSRERADLIQTQNNADHRDLKTQLNNVNEKLDKVLDAISRLPKEARNG